MVKKRAVVNQSLDEDFNKYIENSVINISPKYLILHDLI